MQHDLQSVESAALALDQQSVRESTSGGMCRRRGSRDVGYVPVQCDGCCAAHGNHNVSAPHSPSWYVGLGLGGVAYIVELRAAITPEPSIRARAGISASSWTYQLSSRIGSG